MLNLNDFLRGQLGELTFSAPMIDVSDKVADSGREFIITNGLGSYASGGQWGESARRYHGLFVPALTPPVERTVMFDRIEETVTTGGATPVALATDFWASGAVSPDGYKLVEGFTVDPVPTWCYKLAGGRLIKQLAMVHGKQQVFVGYSWLADDGAGEAKIDLALLVNNRNFHFETNAWDGAGLIQPADGQVSVKMWDGAPELVLRYDRGSFREDRAWYRNFLWLRERDRGLNDHEDKLRIGYVDYTLKHGETLTIIAELGGAARNSDPDVATIGDAVKRVRAYQKELLAKAGNPTDPYQRALVVAADQFLVRRDSTNGSTVIAGYHWFNDWGRDSMISLTGLALATGRFEEAKSILATFGHYESQGMLPNVFPDSGQTPEYNTSDATLWWAYALYQYFAGTGDIAFVREELPLLDEVVAWHKKGTRHKLHLDESDGLISGGEEGVQLTWMDAMVAGYVVTPRRGKAVEICALWYNLLRTLAELYTRSAQTAGCASVDDASSKASQYEAMAAVTKVGMAKFWNAERGCLYDVIGDDGGKDASIRPNQVFALSLPYTAFTAEQARSVVAVVDNELYTPYGLRTLSPEDPAYKGRYGNGKAQAGQWDRDITYHQGTVWPWLLGAWVDARLLAYGETAENVEDTLSKLDALMLHIYGDAGLGSVSEIFDGDAPHKAQGCIAQAWSVAELLRARKRLLALRARPA